MMAFYQVFWTFLKLGCTSFGGPIAHLIYFRHQFVEREKWLSDQDYTQIVGLCQTLPGPASSQVGFALGMLKAGIWGGIAAFVGFTLPSFILLVVFANFITLFDSAVGAAALHGLIILAFVVVLQGVLGMAKQLCASKETFTLAALAFIAVLTVSSVLVQAGVILLALVLAYLFLDSGPNNASNNAISANKMAVKSSQMSTQLSISRTTSVLALCLFLGLFILLPFAETLLGQSSALNLANTFYFSGALVFGGGHVVLPLLEQATVAQGIISEDAFLAGYGATQAVPGPMFAFAAYLGFVIDDGLSPVVGALLATIFVFLPGFLLVIACLPTWQSLSQKPGLKRAFAGANAAVVGLLAAALYNPIFQHAILNQSDVIISVLAFTALAKWKVPVLSVLGFCIAASIGVSQL